MPRLLLIHWKAEEAPERLARLRAAGYEAEHWNVGPGAVPPFLPDAFVIDLSRLPSQGRDFGSFLRRRKATRNVPLVFAGGEPEKVASARQLLPDATFSPWAGIAAALAAALAEPPAKPVVRDAMAGYAGAPLAKKLGIRPDSAVALAGAPEDFAGKLTPLPEGVAIRNGRRGAANLILLFVQSRRELDQRFPAAVRCLEHRGSIWIAWPKKSSGVVSDLGEATVRAFGLGAGFVDYKICAIDRTWSALLFTRRISRSAQA